MTHLPLDHNDYLDWYIPRVMAHDTAQGATIDLHSSGVAAMDAADFPPAPGDPWAAPARFEAALAAWQGLDPRELLFTPGATGGTLLALLALGRPGGRLLVESPIYEPMLRQAHRLGRVSTFPRGFAQGWRVPLGQVLERIPPDTDLVMITEPHNPSGRFSPREDIQALARAAARHGAILLVNEIYRGFSERPSLHGLADNLLVVSSLSKLLGSYWARLGWISGPQPLVSRLRTAHLNLGMASSPSAAVGLTLMERAEELRRRAVRQADAGRQVLAGWVDTTPGATWLAPQGPGFGCVSLPVLGHQDVAFAERLHRHHGVLTIPGSFFGAPGALRISWLQAGDRLEAGLDALGEALGRWAPGGAGVEVGGDDTPGPPRHSGACM